MPRRRENSQTDPDEEQDELERVEEELNKRKKKSKGSKSSKSRKHREDDEEGDEDGGDAMDVDEDDNSARAGKGKKKAASGKSLDDKEISEKARELVRLAICTEGGRKTLKREDINKKVLEGSNTKAFNAVLSKANSYLKRVFGMELIPLIPRDVEAEEEAAATAASQRQKKKKKKRNGDEESSSVDEAAATAAAAAAGKKRKPAARAFALRSTLPADVIAKAIVPMPERIANDPAHTARFAEDAHSELGSAGIARDELKEWKLGRDEIFDWRTGPEQRALMGLLNVILSLIMVNERVLTDEQLMNHLKRLDLRLSTPLPLNPNALNPDKQTLNTFLAQLIKQQYLEKTKVAAAVSGGANAAAAAGAAKNTQGTQRAKATQNTRAGAEAAAEEGAGGSADEEWRWGPRAYVEIGEKGIASFIKDFYGTLASAAEPGANGRPAKDARILEKEILKGTTGGKSKTLQDAREEGADAEE